MNLKNTIPYFICCLLIFCSFNVHSQSPQAAPVTPSPNAQNLGLFGEIPVSLNSGLPSVSIPIYEIKTKSINVPISLDYHASGVRQDVHPSWVGLGWNLQAGGAITREVKGYEDEANCNSCPSGTAKGGYYFSHARNTRSDWSSTTYLKDYRFSDYVLDFEPDEFRFSFPGHSGVFFMDENGTWRVQCDQMVKVVFDNDFIVPFSNTTGSAPEWTSSRTFKKFTIIDEFGVKYIFGNIGSTDENSIEYSDQLIVPDRYNSIATSWNLKQIVSPDGNEVIDFNYQRGPYQSVIYKSISNEQMCNNFSTPQFFTSGRLISPVYLTGITNAKTGLSITFGANKSDELTYTEADYNDLFRDNNRAGLSELLSAYGKIPYFNANPPGSTPGETFQWALVWLKLNSINISTKERNLKTVVLKYDNLPTERLRLSGVEIRPAASIQTGSQLYDFGYFNGSLPGYVSTLGDHWGFVNNSPLRVQSAYDAGSFYPLKNPADLATALVGTLKSITYPTRGKTIFEYEQHKYAQSINIDRTVISQAGTAGGLRIRSIKNIDNNGNEETKNYWYVKGYTPSVDVNTLASSGILESLPRYWYDSGTLYDQANRAFSFSTFSSNPIVPMTSNSSGQHISYSEVVETRSDGAYTISNFTSYDPSDNNMFQDNPPDGQWNTGIFPYVPVNSRSFERGRLKGKFVYNNAGHPTQSEEYEFWRPDGISFYAARNIRAAYKNNCVDNARRTSVARAAYLLYYYPVRVGKITSKQYGNPGYTNVSTTTKSFVYDYYGMPLSETSSNSKGEKTISNFQYAYNYFQGMQSKNMLEYKSNITDLSASKSVKTTSIDYGSQADSPDNYYPRLIKERTSYSDPDHTVLQFDSYVEGNIVQQTLKGAVKESFEWGYNKTQPIAKVVNASNNYIESYEALPSKVSLDVRSAHQTTFTTYYPGDITLAIRLTSPPTQGFTVHTDLSGAATDGISLCFPYGSYTCGDGSPSSLTFPNLPAGDYRLDTFPIGDASAVFANVDCTFSGRRQIVTGTKEFYVQNFEESSDGVSGDAHTGSKYFNGSSYELNWVRPNTRTYVYSYWYHANGEWKYSGELSYAPADNKVILTGGDGYDDIRIYPKDAAVTTYTYLPEIGVSSIIDAKGLTSYYEYGDFGVLKFIMDDKKNIIKSFENHYKP